MSDTKISQDPSASPLLSTAIIPVVQDGTNKKTTVADVVAGLLDETAHDLLDHTGLTGIPAAYSLPTASTTVLGGVRVDGTTVTISNGVISSSGGSGMTNPMTAAGDIIYGGTSGTPTRLAKGADGQVLTLASGLPSWGDSGGGFDPLVAEYIVTGSPRTEVTFSDLDGNAAGGYALEAILYGTAGTSANLTLEINGVAINSTNYKTEGIVASTTTVSAVNNTPAAVGSLYGSTGLGTYILCDINIADGYIWYNARTSICADGYAPRLQNFAGLLNSSSQTNITQLKIISGSANTIDVDSKLMLYKRK